METESERNRAAVDSHNKFVEYYKEASLQTDTVERFERIRDLVLSCLGRERYGAEILDVADVGCGAGTQALIWAQDGHNVHGLDINRDLVHEATTRAETQKQKISFVIGSAEALPWGTETMDVCLVPELLEHVPNWRTCLDEFSRVLKPGGVLYISTSNKLCPKQEEFTLPLYSWYPPRLKRYCERLATTSKPQWVNYAKYPAVNWFSCSQLKHEFLIREMVAFDRIEIRSTESNSRFKRGVARVVSAIPLLQFVVQVITPYSLVLGVKKSVRSAP